jgi:alpha-D-xyloside xylohydrolase
VGVELWLYSLQEGKEAVCRIPDINGRIAMTAKAERKLNTITLSSTTLPHGMKYVLKNLWGVEHVSGAETLEEESGIIIVPNDKHVTIRLKSI